MTETYRYTTVAVTLHWIIAFSIIGLILGGWQMTGMEPGAPGQEQLYQLHKSFGITVLVLTVARVIWRLMNPPPPLPEGMSAWERVAAHGAHVCLYGLMIAMPLTGWLYVSTAYEFDVPTVLFGVVSWPDLPFVGFLTNEFGHGVIEFSHAKLAWLAIGLIVLHVGGAVKHDMMDSEGVLNRILPGWLGPTKGPVQAPRGRLAAFGTATAVFLGIAAVPVIAQGTGSAGASVERILTENWTVDADKGPITFAGVHDGSPYTGTLPDWEASIVFDPADLAGSSATVSVDLTSAVASKKLYTDSLKAPEWFNVKTFPSAAISVSGFTATGDTGRYAAEAALSLKEGGQTVPLAVDIAIDGETAEVSGEAVFSRQALDLGMSSDPNADWVDDEVSVSFAFTATRLNN
ncbi:MAG: cytochrome b/b6 domain-containing protein [Pseudomonadota bacterium]